MRATILVGRHLKRGDLGDVEVLPDGVKFKLPGTMKKKFLMTLIMSLIMRNSTLAAAVAWFTSRSGELFIPYGMVTGIELVEEKTGLATPKAPFIRLHYRGEQWEQRSITFAVHGWNFSNVKRDETIALFEELKRRLGYA
jgi:hypothetical protein